MKKLLLAFVILVAMASEPAYAAQSYCQYGHETAVLFVDRTTKFDKVDRSIFLDALGNLIDRLGSGDRLVAVTMTGAFTDNDKLFDQCKPGCPDDGFFASLMSSCSATVARSELRRFTRSLALTLANLLRDPEQTPQSDLFRTIAEVTHDYATSGNDSQPIRDVVLFSDLLENSDLFPEQEFRRISVARALEKLKSAEIAPDVSSGIVQVYGFGRDDSPRRPPLPQIERQRIAAIWQRWFKDGGATDVEIGFR